MSGEGLQMQQVAQPAPLSGQEYAVQNNQQTAPLDALVISGERYNFWFDGSAPHRPLKRELSFLAPAKGPMSPSRCKPDREFALLQVQTISPGLFTFIPHVAVVDRIRRNVQDAMHLVGFLSGHWGSSFGTSIWVTSETPRRRFLVLYEDDFIMLVAKAEFVEAQDTHAGDRLALLTSFPFAAKIFTDETGTMFAICSDVLTVGKNHSVGNMGGFRIVVPFGDWCASLTSALLYSFLSPST
eukprot:TRINITY_DN10738_c0_g1_i1.p1 TRINITY_DN10738_c0_g1~~TRINITY_DN10738_c0_g1_i1.p1  ORF type:complete len:257 (-),score=31.72 TRINITY_DN10738_c0_g1_i1:18-740(-)